MTSKKASQTYSIHIEEGKGKYQSLHMIQVHEETSTIYFYSPWNHGMLVHHRVTANVTFTVQDK